jgi:hypothetical protein
MRWVIQVTHQDDMGLSTTCEYVIQEAMLGTVPQDYRTYVFEKMVKQVEAKLKEKNT